jgi:hypothetical protein
MFAKDFIIKTQNAFYSKNTEFLGKLNDIDVPLVNMFLDIYNIKLSSVFTIKNKYKESQVYQSIILLFRILWKHSISLSNNDSDFAQEKEKMIKTINNFLQNKTLAEMFKKEFKDLDEKISKLSLPKSFFIPLNILSSDLENPNLIILLMVLFIINSIYIKENFTGPGYLAFRTQTEFKKTYKINHFEKYNIPIDQATINIFKNEITSHVDNLQYDSEFKIEEISKDAELVSSPNILAWTFEKFKIKSNLKLKSQKFDDWYLIDGEEYQRPTKLLHMFKLLEIVFDDLYEKKFDGDLDFYIKLERARIANNMSKLVSFPTETLKKRLNTYYSEIMQISQESEGI